MFDKETIELFVRIGPIVGGAFAVITPLLKIMMGWSGRLRQQRRDDYKFVRDFFADRKEIDHPYLLEQGMRAIVHHDKFTAPEIEFLLSRTNPSISISRLGSGRRFTALNKALQRFEYKGQVAKTWHRRLKFLTHSILYFLFAVVAVSPLFFVGEMAKANTHWVAIAELVATGLFGFGPIAYVNLMEFRDLWAAKRLIDSQNEESTNETKPIETLPATVETVDDQLPEPLPLTKQEEIFYSETLKTWFASRMERDKSLITLSWGGVVAIIALLVTAKLLPMAAWAFALLSLAAFTSTVVLVLIIFRGNTDSLGEILRPGSPEVAQRVEKRLRLQDRVALAAFITGIISASVAGLVAASIK